MTSELWNKNIIAYNLKFTKRESCYEIGESPLLFASQRGLEDLWRYADAGPGLDSKSSGALGGLTFLCSPSWLTRDNWLESLGDII